MGLLVSSVAKGAGWWQEFDIYILYYISLKGARWWQDFDGGYTLHHFKKVFLFTKQAVTHVVCAHKNVQLVALVTGRIHVYICVYIIYVGGACHRSHHTQVESVARAWR